jgi:hypothetical protein
MTPEKGIQVHRQPLPDAFTWRKKRFLKGHDRFLPRITHWHAESSSRVHEALRVNPPGNTLVVLKAVLWIFPLPDLTLTLAIAQEENERKNPEKLHWLR